MVKIMVVDDEAIVRRTMQRILKEVNIPVEVVGFYENALDAISEMTNGIPDILFTDVKMPVMDGIELVRRSKEMYPLLQCVILSGYDEFSLAQAAMLEGVRHYLLKPCTKNKVEQVISECITQIEKEKKEFILDDHSRKIVTDKMCEELMELTTEGTPVSAEIVKGMIASYGDQGLLREIAAVLALKCNKEGDSQKTVSFVTQIFEEKTSIYKCVADILNELRSNAEKDDNFVEKIKKFVEENYHISTLNLRHVADCVVFMNAQYVGKRFYKMTGMKFSEYLLMVRMEHSIRMLSGAENYKMYEIAENVGLGKNIQYFYQLFKNYTGLTPKEYREKVLEHSNLQ